LPIRKTLAIARKETQSYFVSPIAYVVALVFVSLTGYFFVDAMSSDIFPEASVNSYTGRSIFILALVGPLLTMKLLAEEQKLGTIELLLTSPVRDWEVILGKFLASLTIFGSALALTLVYVVFLFAFGNPDLGPIVTAYVGLFLFGAGALAVGLFTSALTSNQIVAAILSYGVLTLLTIIHLAADQVDGAMATFLNELSMVSQFEDFTRGILNLRSVIYYVSMIVVFLFLAVRALEFRRWK
jgi:ABC-2 type transport system permease protein